MGVDDREEKTARFCLLTSTQTIEQYCKRRLLRKKHFERIEYHGDLFLPLSEYPVISMSNEKLEMSNGKMLGSEFYRVIPDCGTNMDFPYSIELSPAVKMMRDIRYIKAVYWAGYKQMNSEREPSVRLTMNNEKKDKGKGDIYVPADLAAACLELAMWNMNRYRGKRIGMTGNIRGSGKDGEHFEMSMPENVKALLEPYRRKTI